MTLRSILHYCAVYCLLAGFAVARADEGSAPPRPLLVWQDGWTDLTVDADGVARYRFTPRGWGAPKGADKQAEQRLAKSDLDEIERALAAAKVCQLRSRRQFAVPEETHATLSLGFARLRCDVSLWGNEWHQLPEAAPSKRVLDGLVDRVAHARP